MSSLLQYNKKFQWRPILFLIWRCPLYSYSMSATQILLSNSKKTTEEGGIAKYGNVLKNQYKREDLLSLK